MLSSRRLHFARFSEADIPALAELLADTSVTRNITSNGSSVDRCLASARHRIEWHNSAWQRSGYGVWSLWSHDARLAPSDCLLGWCGFTPPDSDASDPEILYAVRADCRGRGVAFEAARFAIDWLFAKTDSLGVTAVLFERLNPGSAAVVRKLGMTHGGRMAYPVFLPDQPLADEVAEYEIWRLENDPVGKLDELVEACGFRTGQLRCVTGFSCAALLEQLGDSLNRRCARLGVDPQGHAAKLATAFKRGSEQAYMDCFRVTRERWFETQRANA